MRSNESFLRRTRASACIKHAFTEAPQPQRWLAAITNQYDNYVGGVGEVGDSLLCPQHSLLALLSYHYKYLITYAYLLEATRVKT
jgi:hypothetical protein